MTLIVGIRCSDGIVVGADGAATLGSMGHMTVQQKTVKKLSILEGKIIVGVSGPVGIGQRLRAVIEEAYKSNRFKGRAELAMGVMRKAFWDEVVGNEWNVAGVVSGTLGPQIAATSANSAMLLALPIEKKPELIQFDQQCAPELATDELPFVAIGGGQPIADPFLGFARRVFWPKQPPSINDGVFSAVWALRHAIEHAPGGIADPIQIAVLKKGPDGGWHAEELEEAELLQHEEAVKDAEQALSAWRSQFTAAPAGDSPEQPPGA